MRTSNHREKLSRTINLEQYNSWNSKMRNEINCRKNETEWLAKYKWDKTKNPGKSVRKDVSEVMWYKASN